MKHTKDSVYATNSIAPIAAPKGKPKNEVRGAVRRSEADLRTSVKKKKM